MSKTIDRLQTLMVARRVPENKFLRLLMQYIDDTDQIDTVLAYIRERTDEKKYKRKEEQRMGGGRWHV